MTSLFSDSYVLVLSDAEAEAAAGFRTFDEVLEEIRVTLHLNHTQQQA